MCMHVCVCVRVHMHEHPGTEGGMDCGGQGVDMKKKHKPLRAAIRAWSRCYLATRTGRAVKFYPSIVCARALGTCDP